MTAGTWLAVAFVLVAGFGVLVLALLRAAGRTSRREETIRRCGGRANTYTPPPGSTWTPERMVQGGGLRRIS